MVSSPIRHCENDDAGARLTYEAIDFDDAAQRDWLVADLRRGLEGNTTVEEVGRVVDLTTKL